VISDTSATAAALAKQFAGARGFFSAALVVASGPKAIRRRDLRALDRGCEL
jgi:hypothetical protein